MTHEDFKRMFAEEEKLLEESHRQTMEQHEEIMAMLEKAKPGEVCKKGDTVY